MNTLHELHISVTVESPFLVQGNDPGRFGIDATQLTNAHGVPIIPGTLLVGRVREARPDLAHLFGDQGFERSQRGRVLVQDLALQPINGNKDTVRERLKPEWDVARIEIDDARGSVKQGAMLVIEQIAQAGAELCFSGTWHVWATVDEAKGICGAIETALQQQTQLGAYRSNGFGRLVKVEVSRSIADEKTRQPRAGGNPSAPASWPVDVVKERFKLTFTTPFCVGASTVADNLFESSDIITGGTLKGALAQSLLWQTDCKSIGDIKSGTTNFAKLAAHFDNIRFTHALPTPVGQARPMPLPYSLVRTGDTVQDVWRCSTAPSHSENETALAFQVDWKDKDRETANNISDRGWGVTKTHLRVRTAIENGSAKDKSLFAYECRYSPLDETKGENQGKPITQWLFDIDIFEVPENDRKQVWTQLQTALEQGLTPIGKTDAHAKVAVACHTQNRWGDQITAHSTLQKGQIIPVVLVSDALLFTTQVVRALAGDVSLQGIYEAAFKDLIGDASLALSHFFARQKLVGGAVLLNHQIQKQASSYQPWILTEAGSVFVFEVHEPAKAKVVLDRWRKQGLALPPSLVADYGDNWQHNPYIPQNGYGEVAIQPDHGFDLYPSPKGDAA